MTRSIDLNCDLGESFGLLKIGNDESLFPYITSCNIACGYHGGDPLTMKKTIQLAIKHHVIVGAHPAYPDLQGFGRRRMEIPSDELRAMIQYQVGGLMALCTSQGTSVRYVKPHGALYNRCSQDRQECETVIKAIRSLDANLVFMGLAGSIMQKVAQELDHPFAAEAFIDRRYTPEGALQSRQEVGSVINSIDEAIAQVRSILLEESVNSTNGQQVSVRADSLCIHGDNPQAMHLLEAVDRALQELNIEKATFIR